MNGWLAGWGGWLVGFGWLVVVGDFNAMCVGTFPAEANAPLVVDADAVLSGAVVIKFFEAVFGRRTQSFNLRTAVQREGFAQDFEADAVCAFSTRTLRCVERKAQAADGQKIVQNRPH
jgi:hypothetical protein